ncbi:hypothetical protein [Nannocystis bainbridge]|uniref:Uncharacterized protein n=1 Tax=Nannocystis bainbridge TaxID=2995303 RepID=A0ABT5E5Y0_9BACT|nr:hypothetical protein [Nannocystis bainbridge]MDC0720853.1 hypothetical protein [Nannocystis bainbridge]
MNCRPRLAIIFVALALVACALEPPSYAAYTAAVDLLTEETGGSTSTTTIATDSTASMTSGLTTSEAPPATTEIGTESGSDTGTTSGDAQPLPLDVELFLNPSSVSTVGEVKIDVWTSRPVATIDIFDGDKPIVLGAAPKAPVTMLEVTSDQIPGDGIRKIRAVGHTEDGVSDQAEKDLLIDVAPGGTDVWPPYVHAGSISGFTGVVLLDNQSIAACGFLETKEGLVAIVVQLDGATGKVEKGPISLGKVAFAAAGSGPAIARGDDGAVYVASTRAGSTWAVSKVRTGDPLPLVWTATGELKTKAFGIEFAGDRVIVVGAIEIAPGTHDLKVWWLAAHDGELLDERTFAMAAQDDKINAYDELARAAAIVDGELVVVGEREIQGKFNWLYRRTVVLRFSLDNELLDEWTSPGELLEEDAGMAVTPLRDGGFAVTGWGRNLNTIRQVQTRWFSPVGEAGPVRTEATPGSDAIAYAIGEDREGKLVLAGSRTTPATDADAWIFAIPGPLGAHTWDVIRSGPGKGPDEAADLAIGPWGHVSVVGGEFADLQPRAFAMRLYP